MWFHISVMYIHISKCGITTGAGAWAAAAGCCGRKYDFTFQAAVLLLFAMYQYCGWKCEVTFPSHISFPFSYRGRGPGQPLDEELWLEVWFHIIISMTTIFRTVREVQFQPHEKWISTMLCTFRSVVRIVISHYHHSWARVLVRQKFTLWKCVFEMWESVKWQNVKFGAKKKPHFATFPLQFFHSFSMPNHDLLYGKYCHRSVERCEIFTLGSHFFLQFSTFREV